MEKNNVEEKDVYQELEEIEERYRKILQLSRDAVFIHNNGIIVYANPKAYKMLEIERQEDLINKSILKFIHSDYHNIVKERIQHIMECEGSMPIVEEKFISSNGRIIYTEVTATNIPYGGIKHCLIFVRDIDERKRLEAFNKKYEEMLKRVTENTLDLLAMLGNNFIVNYATPSHYNVLGYSAEEMVGISFVDVVHPEDKEQFLNNLQRAIDEKDKTSIRWRCLCKNGNYKYLESQVNLIIDNIGNLDCMVISSRDITKRVEAENALRKNEKKYRWLFNNVNDSIYLYKLNDNGIPAEFIEVNNVACERLGYSREEFSNMNVKDFNVDLSMEDIGQRQKQLLTTGHSLHKAINKTKDGKLIPVEVNSILLTIDDEKYVLSICRDITEREKHERALRESEEKYRQLVEALPYGVYIRTKERGLFANKAGLEYLGAKSVEELRSKLWEEFIIPHPSYAEQFKKIHKQVITKGYLPQTEERYIRLKDNKVLDVETIVTRSTSDSDEDTFLVVTRDISYKKKAEELERNMKEKSKQLDEAVEYERLRTEFFANISHELRTPVNVIFSTIQLLNINLANMDLAYSDKEKFKRHMAIMKQNCFRLIRLINNLIDVSRIDAGFFDLNLSNNNIVSVVEDITLSIVEYLANKDISLIFDTDVEEKYMACDPDLIERIMLNLISNAIKFTDPGGSVFVNVYDREDSVIISVKDTGIGISEEKLKSIFERFIQVDKSLTRNREGSGIGLSLVKALVELHKGTIEVKSKPGEGSEFIIVLPAMLVEDKNRELDLQRLTAQANIEKIDIEFSDIY
ncbi:PAS domain S-box protein [Clostridium thermarum]|uniref:PAS domain S-box protein n=1 Tax=Clostridium thermarum TaxID=1716543 RepID=UPI0013CF8D4B|nr:PAS domain S-box protein [Clostridium thermarum]